AGPWLRVQQVGHSGARFTAHAALDELLAGYAGAPLLTVDTGELAARVAQLPAVAEARVETRLPNSLAVTVVEKEPAITWRTPAALLVAAADGSVIAELPLDADLGDGLAGLPSVVDERRDSRLLTVGDRLPAAELATARRLMELDPELLGSTATALDVRLDDEHGFVLVCPEGGWEAALGVYGLDPRATPGEAEALLQRQVAAIRTLFSVEDEAGVSWLDARNPGKVYWAP
ncbi:MAG TPA: FtsQ-type POTRA domain-containing protein, partial [candidate division Zixibacteria bacterium]|nr:FtsQ-type POTRA domain-containing protein [candidate division Zixibacteria bacterium]